MLGNGEVAHDGAFGVEELNLGATLDEAVCDFQLGLEFPGGNALFLDGEVLGERYVGLERLGGIRSDVGYMEGSC